MLGADVGGAHPRNDCDAHAIARASARGLTHQGAMAGGAQEGGEVLGGREGATIHQQRHGLRVAFELAVGIQRHQGALLSIDPLSHSPRGEGWDILPALPRTRTQTLCDEMARHMVAIARVASGIVAHVDDEGARLQDLRIELVKLATNSPIHEVVDAQIAYAPLEQGEPDGHAYHRIEQIICRQRARQEPLLL